MEQNTRNVNTNELGIETHGVSAGSDQSIFGEALARLTGRVIELEAAVDALKPTPTGDVAKPAQ